MEQDRSAALTTDELPAGRAWGSYPDAAPLDRRLFHLPTPGAANNPGAPALSVFVNEWMASDAGAVAAPADGDPDLDLARGRGDAGSLVDPDVLDAVAGQGAHGLAHRVS